MKASKLSDGVYTYKNYRIEYKGWWEATNVYTNCVEFREHTLTEIIEDIDEWCDDTEKEDDYGDY